MMVQRNRRLWRLALLTGVVGVSALAADRPKAPSEPRITSVSPLSVAAGTPQVVTIRGTGLAGARAVTFREPGILARVLGTSQEPSPNQPAPDQMPVDLVQVEITSAAQNAGPLAFRVVAERGISNSLSLWTTHAPLNKEGTTLSTRKLPASLNGTLAERGEVDTHWLEAQAGDVITLSARTGMEAFDAALTLVEPSGSWFDPTRLNRIAFNDEPLYFPGLSTEARLVHRFEKAGRFGVQLRAFSGQGGADYTYTLQVEKGEGTAPSLRPAQTGAWEERSFTRRLPSDWPAQLAARGSGTRQNALSAPVPWSNAAMPRVSIPGIIEGRLTTPAETHRFQLNVAKPQDIAIEIETPEATMPRFNPVVRLLAADGSEVVTNVYTKRNNNGLYMMKMIQAKSTVSLRSSGDYTLEVRDITTDLAADNFAYRVLIRPQVPHAGKAIVSEDRINLEPGESKPLTVTIEREEGFTGLLLLAAEGLPAGVTATAGMANPVERPPLPNGGRLERYTGKPQIASLLLTASDNATPSESPSWVRLVFRTVVDGRASDSVVVKEVPLMVIPRRPS